MRLVIDKDRIRESVQRRVFQTSRGWLELGALFRGRHIIDAIRRRVPAIAGLRILDAGSGQGYTSFLLASEGARVVAAEYFLDRVFRARRIGCDLGLNDIGFVQADVTNLPALSDSFDVAILADVLEHVPSDEAVLAELGRVLRSDGLLVLTTPSIDYYCDDDHQRMIGNPYSDHVRLGYTREVLIEKLARADLQVESVTYWKKPGLTLTTLRLSRSAIPGLRTWAAPVLHPILRLGEKLSHKGYEVLVTARKSGASGA